LSLGVLMSGENKNLTPSFGGGRGRQSKLIKKLINNLQVAKKIK
jgi:hypothetical protein